MKISTITLVVLPLIFGIASIALACPPPSCPSCYYWDGQRQSCIWYGCTWDTNGSIQLSTIYVSSGQLCAELDHGVMASDEDHWYCPNSGVQNWNSDTPLTYLWTKTQGSNPQTGEWMGPTNTWVVLWRAPPCTGSVGFNVTVDDIPNPIPQCDNGNRNDTSLNPSRVADVILPPGCSQGIKGADLSVTEIPVDEMEDCFNKPRCGNTSYGVGSDFLIEAVYNSCRWVLFVGWSKDVRSGPCTDNFIDIDGGDDPDLNESNFCQIVNEFLNDNGCGGDPIFFYSNGGCVEIHEDEHIEILEEKLLQESQRLMDKDSMRDVLINCSDACTLYCGDVKDEREDDIESDVAQAYYDAIVAMKAEGESRPIEAARSCFTGIALDICARAHLESWECEHCE